MAKKDSVLDSKLKEVLDTAKVKAAFIFYIPKKGKAVTIGGNMCGEDMMQLSWDLKELAKEIIKEEKLAAKKSNKKYA